MKRAIAAILLTGSLALGGWMTVSNRVQMSAVPVEQEVYVWQQDWSDRTLSSLTNHLHRFSGSVLLASEIQWRGGRPIVRHVDLPLNTLRQCERPLGMAIRIGTFEGLYDDDSPAVDLVSSIIQQHLIDWRMAGVEPSEVQIDFDCPESKLSEYRRWLEQFRAVTDDVRLTFTALPSWLDQRTFRHLAEASDGCVLQVHFYQMPGHPSEATTLCDPAAANRFVRAAARLGTPFRVALPTYGYRVFFGKNNEPLGIGAEGSTHEWTDARTVRELRANADELAGLIKSWQQQHPAAVEGIIWFRMPMPDDTLNWSWPTLNAVMAGRAPSRRLSVRSVSHDDGLVELVASNDGEADVSLPKSVRAGWDNGHLIAADGLQSFTLTDRSSRSVALGSSRTINLSAGESLSVAWLRFQKPTEVFIE